MERVTDKQYWMDSQLRMNLDTVCHNLKNDWDFIFIITGTGLVRVGKSVMGQQIGYYVAYKMQTPFSVSNIVFSGEDLMKVAHDLPPNSVIIYDESRAELDSKKTMEKLSKVLMDFFAECGMYNHFIILVMPDFFEMNKKLAVNRSDALVNVFRTAEKKKNRDGQDVLEYGRGHFEFFGRRKKKYLFINGKKHNDSYSAGQRDYYGEFRLFWVVDKEEYEKKKRAFLERDRLQAADRNKYRRQRDALLKILTYNYNAKQTQVSEHLKNHGEKLSQVQISRIVNGVIDEN